MDPCNVISVAADTKARPIRRPSSLDVTSCSSALQYRLGHVCARVTSISCERPSLRQTLVLLWASIQGALLTQVTVLARINGQLRK